MNQSSHLYELQKIDGEIDKINLRLVAINQQIEADETLRNAQKSLDAARKNHLQADHSLREIEERARNVQVKISQSESSLYGGKIRNPKELQDLQIEISSLKKRLSVLEDEQLDAMMYVESAEQTDQECQKQLLETEASLSTKMAGLRGEQSKLEKNRDRFMMERQATASSISAENLKIYDRLHKQKNGLAVAQIDDDSCTACGSEIRPAEKQAARLSQQMVLCATCGRILYGG